MTTKEAMPEVNFCSMREKGGEEDERGRKISPPQCTCMHVPRDEREEERECKEGNIPVLHSHTH